MYNTFFQCNTHRSFVYNVCDDRLFFRIVPLTIECKVFVQVNYVYDDCFGFIGGTTRKHVNEGTTKMGFPHKKRRINKMIENSGED